jgi:hypothetical protein
VTPIEVKRFVDKLFGVRVNPRHIGEGQKRATVRLAQHRKQQADRTAPALPAFQAARAEIARKRAQRFSRNSKLPLSEAAGHIKAMSREQAIRRAA